MVKLVVGDDFAFNPDDFDIFAFPSGSSYKTDPDLYKITFSTGEVYVRGGPFEYSGNDLDSGPITSIAYNVNGESLVKARNIAGLDAMDVNNAASSPDPEAAGKALLAAILQGHDVLKGGDKNDVLFGLGGDDTIKGHGGKDLIVGGKGKDDLFGGDDSKKDTFHFDNGDSGKKTGTADRIHDFHSGKDVIDLSGTGAHKSDLSFEDNGHSVAATIAAHDGYNKDTVILFLHTDSVHDISKGDFFFG